MRMLINAVPLVRGGGKSIGLNFCRHLGTLGRDHDVLVLVPAGDQYERVCAEAGIPFQSIARRRLYPLWRLWFDQVQLPRLAVEWKADVLFSMGNLGPISPPVPHVLLFHNAYFAYPSREWRDFASWYEIILVSIQSAIFRKCARASSRVIAQTETLRRRVADRCSIPYERLAVVPNGAGATADMTNTVNCEKAQRIASASAANKFLVLAEYYGHKNLEFVLETARELKSRGVGDFAFFLTISPAQDPRAARLLERIEAEGFTNCVHNVGPIRPDHLGAVYAAADAVFMPSLLESFSSTFVETAAAHRPMLVSDLDFAREICGEAALYFDPRDPVDAANQVMRFLDPTFRRFPLEVSRPIGALEQASQLFHQLTHVGAGAHVS